MNLETDLRRALRPEDPPPGFADRILALTAQSLSPVQPRRWWQLRGLVFVPALAAALAIALTITAVGWQRYEQQRALEARRQLITALTVTQTSLQKAQQRIRRVSAKPPL